MFRPNWWKILNEIQPPDDKSNDNLKVPTGKIMTNNDTFNVCTQWTEESGPGSDDFLVLTRVQESVFYFNLLIKKKKTIDVFHNQNPFYYSFLK